MSIIADGANSLDILKRIDQLDRFLGRFEGCGNFPMIETFERLAIETKGVVWPSDESEHLFSCVRGNHIFWSISDPKKPGECVHIAFNKESRLVNWIASGYDYRDASGYTGDDPDVACAFVVHCIREAVTNFLAGWRSRITAEEATPIIPTSSAAGGTGTIQVLVQAGGAVHVAGTVNHGDPRLVGQVLETLTSMQITQGESKAGIDALTTEMKEQTLQAKAHMDISSGIKNDMTLGTAALHGIKQQVGDQMGEVKGAVREGDTALSAQIEKMKFPAKTTPANGKPGRPTSKLQPCHYWAISWRSKLFGGLGRLPRKGNEQLVEQLKRSNRWKNVTVEELEKVWERKEVQSFLEGKRLPFTYRDPS